MGKVSDEFKLFFQTVSIRGVPRIFTSKQFFLSAFWLLIVFLCFGILLWQLCLLFIKYFSYPYTTTTNEENSYPIFPTVSVCNLNPILMITSEFTSVLTWSQHLKNVQNCIEKADYTEASREYNISKDSVERLIRDLESPGGYFSNFPIYQPIKSDSKNMIIDYGSTDWNWMRANVTATITPYWDSNYFNCYSIILDSEDNTRVQAMSLVMYINNFPSVTLPGIYQLGGTVSNSLGVSVRIHFPGSRGEMKQGINVSPGSESTFFIEMINRTRLKYPYNKWNCTNAEGWNETGFLYNINDCIELCLQQQIVDKCGCVSINHIFSRAQLKKTNSLLCGNMSNFEDSQSQYNGPSNSQNFYMNKTSYYPDFLKRLACLNTIETIGNGVCFKQCLLPCKEVTYKYNGMSASWPDVTYQLPIYRKYINNPASKFINQSNFQIYKTLDEMKMNMSMDDEMIISELKKTKLIRENFLQINIIFESRYSHLVEDTESIPSQSLLSSIGGALSLWLGLSFMTLAEVIEFILRIINATFKKKKEVHNITSTKGTATGF